MNVTLEKIDEIIAYLTEADKAISSTYSAGVPARDAIMFSQSTVWFRLGMKDEKAMAAGMALYKTTMAGLKTNMFDVYSKVSSGQLNYTQALRQWKQFTGQFYTDFFKSGAMSMGNPFYAEMGPTRRDLGILAGARRYEEKFFKRYLNDIIKQRSGNFTPADEARWARHPLDVRSRYYAESGKAQFFNGMVAGAGDDVEIWWRLGVAEHCDLCPVYATRSYTWSTLPAIPRSGNTPCLYNCKCWLDIKPRSKTTPTPDPRAPMIPRPTVTPGDGAAARFPSGLGQVGGMLMANIDDMFYQMNKIRQMIGLETDAAMKADLILQRKGLNQDIIDYLAKKKVRATPKISVADLTAAAKDAQLRAGNIIDNWAVLKANQEVYVLTGTTLRKGLIQLDVNGRPQLLSSEGTFILNAKYDIVMKAAKKGQKSTVPFDIPADSEVAAALKTKNPKFLAFGTEEKLAAYLKAEYGKGRTMGDLAVEFGVSNARISELFKKYNVRGIPAPIPPIPPIPLPIPPTPVPPPPSPIPTPAPPVPLPLQKKIISSNPKLLAFGTEGNLAAFLKSQYAAGRTLKSLAAELGCSPSRINGLYKKYGIVAGKVPAGPKEPIPVGSMKQAGVLKPPQFTSYDQAERYLLDNSLIDRVIQQSGKIGHRPVQKAMQFTLRELQVCTDTLAQLKNSMGANYETFNLVKVRNYVNAHYSDALSPTIVIGDKIEAHWHTPRLKIQLDSMKEDYKHYKSRLQHITQFGRTSGIGQMTPEYYRDAMTRLAKNYRDLARTIRAIETGRFDQYQIHSNYATGGIRTLEGTMLHEYGHLFEFKNVLACKRFMQEEMGWDFSRAPREWGNQALTSYQIDNLSLNSRYMLEITNRAKCNYKEMWAENFTLFNLGKWERLHPKVVKFFKEFMPDMEPIDLKPDLKRVFMQLEEPVATLPWAPNGGAIGIRAQAKQMALSIQGIEPTNPYFSVADDLLKHDSFKAYVKGLKPQIETTPASRKAVAKYIKAAETGNLDPIIVDKNNLNRIIDGNHRLAAAQKLGVEPKIYAVDRIDFIRGAAREGEMNYLKNLIARGAAIDVGSGIAATAPIRAKAIGQVAPVEPAKTVAPPLTALPATKGKLEPIAQAVGKDPPVDAFLKSNWAIAKEKYYINRVLSKFRGLPEMDVKLVKRIFIVDNQTMKDYLGPHARGIQGTYFVSRKEIGYNVYFALENKTISHEVGHAVYYQTLSVVEKQAIGLAYREAKVVSKFVTKYAGTSAEEFFAENYAYYHESANARRFVDKGIKAVLDKRYGKSIDVDMPIQKASPKGHTVIRSINPNIQAFGTEEAFASWLKAELGKGRTMTKIAGELACSNARVSELVKKFGINQVSMVVDIEPSTTAPKIVVANAKLIHTRADLQNFASTADIIPTQMSGQNLYTHAVRYPNELDAILINGISPGGSGKVYASSGIVRDRGAGFVIFKGTGLNIKQGIDVVEPGLSYSEYVVTGSVPKSNIVKVVRQFKIDNFSMREDELARYALRNQGLDTPDIRALPKEYRRWFNLSKTKGSKVESKLSIQQIVSLVKEAM